MPYYCRVSSTLKDGVIRLLNTLCSAGLLAIPYIYRPFGLVTGVTVTFFISLLALIGLLIQAQVIRYVPLRYASFFSLAQITSPKLGVIFDFAIASRCFCNCLIHLIVIRDLLPGVFTSNNESTNSLLLNPHVQLALITLFVITPFCFSKNVCITKHLTRLTIAVLTYFAFVIVLLPWVKSDSLRDYAGDISIGIPQHSDDTGMMKAISLLIFVFNSHHHMFAMINEQEEISFKEMKNIAIIVNSIQIFITLLIGILGYLTFGDNVSENILCLYPPICSISILKIFYIILMIVCFPFQCYPLRASLNRILNCIQNWFDNRTVEDTFNEQTRNSDASANALVYDQTTPLLTCEGHTIPIEELVEEGSNKQLVIMPMTERNFKLYTGAILICAYLISITKIKMMSILVFIGSTSSTVTAYILPGIFAYQLIGIEYESFCTKRPFMTTFFKYSGLFLAIFGISMIMLYTVFLLPQELF
ncbi:similar to Saccharomyces cerevisiae YER119C AVT6 Vacuolar aspartate and glutamate exporter [Maudiozyma saulgeensis]|uniref:Similar to Saccharomyces cerevisiae YER119C AVT6 Vacuolar aspartate and glutamate exporter n=1 Tax=Maudiozyma saulgeensis TaxID=1789683 RepID=A0A1X7QXR0_9SACH|nr:similar to Saccharomyces cerevisiae YER119C AVT6 Vacuolar aspartate and glutamate exporter [Kazachstania saulgeensis]